MNKKIMLILCVVICNNIVLCSQQTTTKDADKSFISSEDNFFASTIKGLVIKKRLRDAANRCDLYSWRQALQAIDPGVREDYVKTAIFSFYRLTAKCDRSGLLTHEVFKKSRQILVDWDDKVLDCAVVYRDQSGELIIDKAVK